MCTEVQHKRVRLKQMPDSSQGEIKFPAFSMFRFCNVSSIRETRKVVVLLSNCSLIILKQLQTIIKTQIKIKIINWRFKMLLVNQALYRLIEEK